MNDKLNDALNGISDKYIEEAVNYKKPRKPYWIGAVAATLALVILFSVIGPRGAADPTNPILFYPTGTTGPDNGASSAPQPVLLANQLCAPILPQMVEYPGKEYERYREWYDSQVEQYDQPRGYADSLDNFFAASIQQFLKGEGNQTYSPINVYMALAMLAESAEGESRQQILNLLGSGSIEALRTQAGHMWNAHYSADGLTTLLLSNSLWLDDAWNFEESTVDTLAKDYYASLFNGDLGTEEMDSQLRQWLNSCTGNLLQEQVEGVFLPPETIVALASTVYFSAKWEADFDKNKTTSDTFHSPDGDVTAQFMHNEFLAYAYYWGEHYGAISLRLSGNNNMWLILPDEGYTTADILEEGEFLTMLQNLSSWEQYGAYKINLSLPKFDVVSKQELTDGLKKLGVTDVFDSSKADLSGLITADQSGLSPYISKTEHACRVKIDEEGCEAAAYTLMAAAGAAPSAKDVIDFTLDRPFIFIINGRDSVPLFAGVVNEP